MNSVKNPLSIREIGASFSVHGTTLRSGLTSEIENSDKVNQKGIFLSRILRGDSLFESALGQYRSEKRTIFFLKEFHCFAN